MSTTDLIIQPFITALVFLEAILCLSASYELGKASLPSWPAVAGWAFCGTLNLVWIIVMVVVLVSG